MGTKQVRILEMIHLRLGTHRPELLADLAREVEQRGGENGLRVYRHGRIETDLLIHLHRRVPEGVASPSGLGSQLASLLREHGIVEHSVWVEQSGSGAGPRQEGRG